MKKIIAGIDFSDTMGKVLDASYTLAKALDEQLYLVHVVEIEPTFPAYGFTSDTFPTNYDLTGESVVQSKKKLKELKKSIEKKGLLDVQTKVLEGTRLSALLKYSKEVEADMIVLGSHGHGLLGSLLLGSLAEGILRKTEIPTLIIPAEKK